MVGECGIEVLKHPGNSPDLNPIEHVWDWIDVKLRKYPPTSNHTEIKRGIVYEWNAISKEQILKLYESMTKRVNLLKKKQVLRD